MKLAAIVDAAALVLAAARLTRLVTVDQIGLWYVRDPVEQWGIRHEAAALNAVTTRIETNQFQEDVDALLTSLQEYDEARPWTWQKRLSDGVSCRWCVGFWLGVLLLTVDVLTRTTAFGWARPLYRFGVRALALNAAANAVGRWTGTLD